MDEIINTEIAVRIAATPTLTATAAFLSIIADATAAEPTLTVNGAIQVLLA